MELSPLRAAIRRREDDASLVLDRFVKVARC